MNSLKKNLVGRHKLVKYTSILGNLIIFFCLGITKSYAEDNILVIHSYHADFTWTRDIKQGIDEQLTHNKRDVNIFHEFLDSKRYPDLTYNQLFLKYINKKYKNTPIDILMVWEHPTYAMSTNA